MALPTAADGLHSTAQRRITLIVIVAMLQPVARLSAPLLRKRLFSSDVKPLAGITVLSFEQAVAAPLCTCRLADAGARVIKVERSGSGDFARKYDKHVLGESTYFTWLNRGKESIEVDIKNPDDKALLMRILKEADIFVQNLAPGAAARAGFDSTKLLAEFPQLVTLDMSGYGEEGPKKDLKAYDLLVQAETGMCGVTGTPDGPGRIGVSICDLTTGLQGYGAIMQALYAREKTGKGQNLATSLFSNASELMAVPYLQQLHTGNGPKRVGLQHPSVSYAFFTMNSLSNSYPYPFIYHGNRSHPMALSRLETENRC
jgi:crotonobetainyl-CoA:carnitine CoA-transferase CaiB-like acyl-CoA transferase